MSNKYIRHAGILGVFLVLFGWYTYLMISGDFSLFVHPRLHIFTDTMIVCIILLLFYMTFMIGDKKLITSYSTGGLLSIIFLIIALFPALGAQIDPSILPIADLTLPKPESVNIEAGEGEISEANSDMGKYVDTAFVIKSVQRDREGNITLTKESYYDTVVELVTKTQQYLGESIKASGVVYKGQDYADDEFGVGLYYMTCCAADAQLVGMKYTTKGVVPHVGQRVELQGTIQEDSEGSVLVTTQNILTIPPMEDPYMYY